MRMHSLVLIMWMNLSCKCQRQPYFLSPQDSNSVVVAPAGPNHLQSPEVKHHLLMPQTTKGWEVANQHFSDTLVPAVLNASTLTEKYSILTDGVYSYFQSSCGTKPVRNCSKRNRPLHNSSLKEVTRKKKLAKQELLRARQQGYPTDVLQSLAKQFFSLVRCHSRLKKAANATLGGRRARQVRSHCHKQFSRYARELLDARPSSNITPTFDVQKAHQYFSTVYKSVPQSFVQPAWMPSPPPPEVQMDCSPFTPAEILRVIKKTQSASAPSPFDRIGYVVFKKCPALIPALADIFNLCWDHSVVPHQWKTAAIKLIPKGSAGEDPSSPSNFRPIALTPCIGKIFTTLLCNRWLKFMLGNKYFNTSLQKAFMPSIPGCTEHQLKLCSVLSEAQLRHKALAVCWLDIANAYGSVHHSLIQFALRHYHAPPQFLSILQALYCGLNATVVTESWDTPLVTLQKGVYQGDPLSVVIFNTVMNTLIDTITTRADLGYKFSGSVRRVNILQYADDTCLVVNSPASCQYLLSKVGDWLNWTGMAVKVPKCQCLSLEGSTGKLRDPQLKLNGAPILYTKDPVRFLGLNVQVASHRVSPRPSIVARLRDMLTAVDRTSLTRRQKLHMYSAGVCPRLTWPLLTQEFPISWVERELDSLATRYIKRWAGLTKSASTAILYLPNSNGGLNLPCLSTIYKKLQVSRQTQFLTSMDGCVRFLADRNLRQEITSKRRVFQPASLAREVLEARPGGGKKALAKAAKALVAEETNSGLLDHWQSLEQQGQMSRCLDQECARVWSGIVKALPEEQMKFALNAALDVLPHNSNLCLWKKKNSSACTLCGENQSLLHVLNNCTTARDLRRYNFRHDLVLREIASTIESYLSPTTSLLVDIGEGYQFPCHIVPTDMRPDIVWWDRCSKSVCLAELTVCFETNFDDAAARKAAKYADLVQQARDNGYRATLLPLQVGSRGVPHYESFVMLARVLNMPSKELTTLLAKTIKAAIQGSFKIWCSRNVSN